mmetsp:Transcript_75267/g.143205  ORF Transcript_75267/g.143205 Transcript_75267/m.143205 type:complete len:265 (-) Transcript_75267:38-832(-)
MGPCNVCWGHAANAEEHISGNFSYGPRHATCFAHDSVAATAEAAAAWARHAGQKAEEAANSAAYAVQEANESNKAAKNAVTQMVYLVNHPNLEVLQQVGVEALKEDLLKQDVPLAPQGPKLQYELGSIGAECLELPVQDKDVCEDAATKMGFQYQKDVEDDDMPYGCYMIKGAQDVKEAFFNHRYGKRNDAATPICVQKTPEQPYYPQQYSMGPLLGAAGSVVIFRSLLEMQGLRQTGLPCAHDCHHRPPRQVMPRGWAGRLFF